jgi:transcriptional regulator with XRE-family HTH domain
MMLVDEFDNFLVFVIAERFTKELQGHKALIGASAEDLSELVSDKVWDECRKSDAYMINLERDIAKYMSNAVKLRFYGSESVSADEVVAFIHEYYRVEKDKNEPVMEHDPAVPEKPQTRGKFAAFFEALREKRKSELTLLEISKRCSISKSMLEAFLSGKAHPKRDTVFKLAYGLKLSQAQLVEMMDAIDQDLKSKAEHKPYKINRANPRDMLLFNELPNRLSIEDLNARLVGSRFQALDQTPLSRAF